MVLHIANRRKEHHSNQQRHLMKPNLSSLSDNEINSGKIWTLLRHNKQFEADANRFSAKYKKATSKRVQQESREAALTDCHQKYEGINEINPFAGTALEWMFPMPIFIKENGDKAYSHPNSWGPIIWPAKGDEIDILKEWKEYEASKQWLTLDTDWFSVSGGFKRDFLFQYRQIDSRPLNPITNDRSDSTSPHETDFFCGWDLWDAIKRRPNLSEVDLAAKSISFKTLQQQYRVLAVPRYLHSKKAVDEAFKPLIKTVKESLPAKESQRFGTNAEWEDFMAIKEIQKSGIPSKAKAIQVLIKDRYPKFELNEARRKYEGLLRKNIEAIETRIGDIYPNFLL
jgi:hypothetical protein